MFGLAEDQLGTAALIGLVNAVFWGYFWWARTPEPPGIGGPKYPLRADSFAPFLFIPMAIVAVVFGVGWIVAKIS